MPACFGSFRVFFGCCILCQHVLWLFRFFWLLWIVLGCLGCLRLFRLFSAALGCVGCFGSLGVAFGCSLIVNAFSRCFELFRLLGCFRSCL